MKWNWIAIFHGYEHFECNLQLIWLSESTCIYEDSFLKKLLNKKDKQEKEAKNDA